MLNSVIGEGTVTESLRAIYGIGPPATVTMRSLPGSARRSEARGGEEGRTGQRQLQPARLPPQHRKRRNRRLSGRFAERGQAHRIDVACGIGAERLALEAAGHEDAVDARGPCAGDVGAQRIADGGEAVPGRCCDQSEFSGRGTPRRTARRRCWKSSPTKRQSSRTGVASHSRRLL